MSAISNKQFQYIDFHREGPQMVTCPICGNSIRFSPGPINDRVSGTCECNIYKRETLSGKTLFLVVNKEIKNFGIIGHKPIVRVVV